MQQDPPDHLGIGEERQHIGGPLLTSFPIKANALGAASIPMTVLNDPQLDGFHLTFQALSIKDKVVVASNRLELRFCKCLGVVEPLTFPSRLNAPITSSRTYRR